MRQAYDYWQNQPGIYRSPSVPKHTGWAPKGADGTKEGGHRSFPKLPASKNAHGAIAAGNLFNCPHWVPQDVVRNRAWGALPPITSPLHVRLKRRSPDANSHSKKAADSLRGCPQGSGEIFGIASHPQTTKMVPTQGNRVGLQLSDASRVVAKTPPTRIQQWPSPG